MQLNVMIVDDEAYIRSGIKAKIDWERMGLFVAVEASDGAEALQAIERGGIDLVITDITMPVMDGLALIRRATELGSAAKFIIVSGYGEFEYARTAMKYGISEYLLKPLKSEELEASLERIKAECLADEQAWQKESASREETKRKEESLLHWLSGSYTRPGDGDGGKAPQPAPEWAAGSMLVGVMKADVLNDVHDAQVPGPGAGRTPTFYRDVETAFQALSEQTGGCWVVRSVRPEHDFIVLFQPALPGGKDKLIRALVPFLEQLERKIGVRFTVGLGSVHDQAEAVRDSYREALFAVKERILPWTGKVIDYARIPVRADKPNFSADTRLLLRFLKEKKWDKAKAHIDHMFRQAVQKKSLSNHNDAYELFIEIYFTIKQFSQEEAAVHADAGAAHTGADLTDIVSAFCHTDQMTDWLYQYLESACRHLIGGQDASGKEIVYRVKAYIREFCSSDLTLNAISEKYHINPIYFSRIFKTYVGESFNSYITRVRMEEARSLMGTTSLRLQEIAEIVGYDDSKYFSKVFKKFFGVSPSQYAESQGAQTKEDSAANDAAAITKV